MSTLLTVNLTEGSMYRKDIADTEEMYLGGLGVNSRLLYDLVPTGADPLGPENALLFGVGPLVGTLLPTACRTEVTAKSPLSGRFGTANGGGSFGAVLRYAGFSYLAFLGAAQTPVMLVIDDEKVRLEQADDLWGLDVWEATDRIKARLGHDFHVAVIGPAGENLVRFASIQNDYFASWGRTGMGAVMGSKRLKAVAVRGSGTVDVADIKTFNKLRREAFDRVQKEPSFGFMKRYGSMVVADPFDAGGALPGRNFTVGSYADWAQTRGRKPFEKQYKEGDVACFSCPIACAHWSRVKEDGPHQGLETRGLEVTFVMEFGAKLEMTSVPEIFRCVDICNINGMDVISAAGSVSFLLEAYDKGLVTTEDLGFVPQWGDYNTVSRLLLQIAGREGMGNLLAEGAKRASQQIPGSEPYAMHVKGVEMPVKDPRPKCDTFTFGYLTNTRGGDSLRGRSPVEAVLQPLVDHRTEPLGVDPEHIEALDMPATLKKEIFGDPPKGVNLPRMLVYAENLIALINCVGFCIRPPVLRSLGPDFYARALTAVTGRKYDEDMVYAAAQRVWDLQHSFNVREGETSQDYCYPKRFYTESLPGPKGRITPPLSREQIEENLREYFQVRGWEF
ncbi:aldehyde ferredoxin oxidoreductase family protein [Dethiobacter alkaliphilus]|uniref:Aldehyde ferredoxin oxidoreductase n=1 Tax=Dethiobacter alkaliphilus AHT 1 TaxID=555088 RepID=C0GID9_DETAL|nr:aldehyde ferredoxin oxidoreductase family protein [Dethiobacter alkaliphilus]EEG76987.1 Aldehyde ferredoxin oxidoreductase [Dethiobacter alkaliphilus AHT 1]